MTGRDRLNTRQQAACRVPVAQVLPAVKHMAASFDDTYKQCMNVSKRLPQVPWILFMLIRSINPFGL